MIHGQYVYIYMNMVCVYIYMIYIYMMQLWYILITSYELMGVFWAISKIGNEVLACCKWKWWWQWLCCIKKNIDAYAWNVICIKKKWIYMHVCWLFEGLTFHRATKKMPWRMLFLGPDQSSWSLGIGWEKRHFLGSKPLRYPLVIYIT